MQERVRLENRIEALLATQGIGHRPSLRSWERDLAALRTGDGRPLPAHLRAELGRLRRRLVLAIEMKSLLLGEAATVEQVRAITEALVGEGDTGVDSVIHLRTMHLGPEELLVAAKIAVNATATGEQVAKAIDAAERRVRSAVPIARVIYLEPDLLRPTKERGERTASTP